MTSAVHPSWTGESFSGNVVLEQQQIVQSDATAVADWNAQQESAASCRLGNLGSCASDAANWVGQNKLAVITGIITLASVACVAATVGICAAVAAPGGAQQLTNATRRNE